MAVTARTLTEEQKRRLLEAHLVKPKVERSPEERAEAVLRATSGRRLPLRVTKDEYRP
jgi:ribulose 1,5-bisphosphate carboxylase large subunit-like protein